MVGTSLSTRADVAPWTLAATGLIAVPAVGALERCRVSGGCHPRGMPEVGASYRSIHI